VKVKEAQMVNQTARHVGAHRRGGEKQSRASEAARLDLNIRLV